MKIFFGGDTIRRFFEIQKFLLREAQKDRIQYI
jgi:hypothetical protein